MSSLPSSPPLHLSPPSMPTTVLTAFHEDIILSILSFVANVPYEHPDANPRSTLTHVLPLVSKQFHRLCTEHDLYWKAALVRLFDDDPYLWKEGAHRIVFEAGCSARRQGMPTLARSGRQGGRIAAAVPRERQSQRCRRGVGVTHAGSLLEIDRELSAPSSLSAPPPAVAGVGHATTVPIVTTRTDPQRILDGLLTDDELVEEGCDALARHPPPHHAASPSGRYQSLFRSIVFRHLRITAPVFFMPGPVRIGRDLGMHFFEPRYRVLIGEVMHPYPISARRGEAIRPREGTDVDIGMARKYRVPTFVYAHQAPLAPTTPATIVEVRRCSANANGTADVILRAVSYVWIETFWERPGTGGLCEARCVRMGREVTDAYEQWCSTRYNIGGDGRWTENQMPVP